MSHYSYPNSHMEKLHFGPALAGRTARLHLRSHALPNLAETLMCYARTYRLHISTPIEPRTGLNLNEKRHMTWRYLISYQYTPRKDPSVFTERPRTYTLIHGKYRSQVPVLPRNPCERAGWRSFREKRPDCTEEQGSRMIAETNA